jgi:hypothetical protein
VYFRDGEVLEKCLFVTARYWESSSDGDVLQR